jgi:hypothetical protein
MKSIKRRRIAFVSRQSQKTAADPNARVRLMAVVAILLIVSYNIPKADASLTGCASCLKSAFDSCQSVNVVSTVCTFVGVFPALCASTLTASGLYCAGIAGTCVYDCL